MANWNLIDRDLSRFLAESVGKDSMGFIGLGMHAVGTYLFGSFRWSSAKINQAINSSRDPIETLIILLFDSLQFDNHQI